MGRMYEARKVCNFLLAHYDAQLFDLTNLRLNKLLYFIQAESLARETDGLIRSHFEAWQYGPVVRTVFDAFKGHESRWISSPARYLDYASGEYRVIGHDDIQVEHAELIASVFDKYSGFSTRALVDLSHVKGGPWEVTYHAWLADKTISPRIPNSILRDFYVTGSIPLAGKH
jgi:uncharacterized phage-associated protein